MLKNFILVLALLVLGQKVFAYGTGYSAYPLLSDKKLISGEFTGITSSNGGIGIQARYTQKLNSRMLFDGGLGISGGERSSRLFVGTDVELFPDYKYQPRISLKATYENAKEFDNRRNIIGVSPIVSKGFNLWGHEAFPFISIPFGVSLDSGNKSYETTISANVGMTGNLPIKGYEHLTASLEGIIGLKDSFSGVFMGVSFPLN